MNRAVALFLLLAYAISWSFSEIGFRLLHLNVALVGVAFMFGPALAAVITTKFVLRRPITSLGPWWRPNRWLAAAVIARPCPEARRAPPSAAPAPAVAATEDRCAAELAAYASARQAARLAADEGHCRSRGRHGAAVRQAAAAVEACLDRR